MKVLLVNPPINQRDENREREPLGIGYLASYLRAHDVEVEIFDGSCGRDRSVWRVVRRILSGHFDVVGITVYTTMFPLALHIALQTKLMSPETVIIFGGHHATAFHSQILEHFLEIDMVIRGEGEITLYETIRQIEKGLPLDSVLGLSYRDGNEVIVNPPRPLIEDIDSLPFPARDLFPPLNRYRGAIDPELGRKIVMPSIISSRGCPYRCRFCSISAFYESSQGKAWRARSADNVADEVEELVNKYGAEHIIFADANFLVQPERVMNIIETLRERKILIPFSFSARADDIIRASEYISALKSAGCKSIELGLESGSQKVLDRFRKGVTVQQNREALSILKEVGIQVIPDFIMFDCETTIDDLSENIAFLEDSNLFQEKGWDPLFTELYLFPDTSIREEIIRKGKAVENIYTLPFYKFDDDKVGLLWAFLLRFKRKYIARLERMRNQVLQIGIWIRSLLVRTNCTTSVYAELKRLRAENHLDLLSIQGIPYKYFKRLLNTLNPSDIFTDVMKEVGELIKEIKESIESIKERLSIIEKEVD